MNNETELENAKDLLQAMQYELAVDREANQGAKKTVAFVLTTSTVTFGFLAKPLIEIEDRYDTLTLIGLALIVMAAEYCVGAWIFMGYKTRTPVGERNRPDEPETKKFMLEVDRLTAVKQMIANVADSLSAERTRAKKVHFRMMVLICLSIIPNIFVLIAWFCVRLMPG